MSKNEFICDCNIIHKEVVEQAKSKMLNNDTVNNLANFFVRQGFG